MIIKETDFLWKCYVRAYKDEPPVKPPGNLCHYFWTAMFGLWQKVLFDCNFFLVFLPWITITCAGISIFHEYKLFQLLAIVSCSLLFIFCAVRIITLIEKVMKLFPEKVQNGIIGTSLLGVIGLIIYLVAKNGKMPDDPWREFLIMLSVMGIAVGIAIAIVVFCLILNPVVSSELFQTCWAYLKAKKQRVCPLLEPPPNWKPEPSSCSEKCNER